MGFVLLTGAEVIGHGTVDVLVHDGVVGVVAGVDALDVPLAAGDGEVIDCAGAALLPGLHDHHCHLLATAAARASVDLTDASDHDEIGRRLGAARPGPDGWVRGIEYDGPAAETLDAVTLDALTGPAPTRVQHRSGAMWVLNSAGIAALDLDQVNLPGVARDAAGRPTGQLWRMDGWLGERLRTDSAPDLAAVSAELSEYGVVGITDATPDLDAATIAVLTSGVLRQRLTLLGAAGPGRGYRLGPYKIVLGDHALPGWDELESGIRRIRPRPVAIHSVTRTSLTLALSVLDAVGAVPGDRIEHGGVVPPEFHDWLARLGVTVVTQPSLVSRRGDEYLDRVASEDLECLWPYRSLVEAGVPVGLSGDAPYGALSPWESIAAAVDRRTRGGRHVAPAERVSARTALRGFLTSPDSPGGGERVVRPGAVADLVVLDRRLDAALAAPADVRVQLTMIGGAIVHRRPIRAGSIA